MRLSRPLVAVAVLVAATAAPQGAGAATKPATAQKTTIDARLRQLRQLVGEASAQEAALLNQLDDARQKRQDLDVAVRRLDGQIADATTRLQIAEAELERLDGGFRDLDRRIADTNLEIADAKTTLAQTVSQMYQQADNAEAAFYTSVILKARSPHDVFAAGRYLAHTATDKRVDLTRITALRDLTQQLRDQLDSQRTDARAQRDVVASQRIKLDGLRAEQATARAGAVREEANEQALLATARSRKAEFERELVALQAQSNSLAKLLRGRQINQALQPSGHGVLKVPVGAPVTSGFGPRVHPIFGDVRMHTGIDFGAGFGTPIHAAGPGVVVIGGPYGGYGNAVVIDHGNGLATLYAHQSALSVRPGQSVKVGQVVGFVGATGFATGPHLHFEVRVKGTPVDPLLYL
jgi:murein DD-endopeptidase MepM/ murein hydrolase activator NlpD